MKTSEMGECDPLISSSSTIRASKTSLIISFIGFLLCIFLAAFLVQFSMGNLWELLLSVDNQADHVPTVNTTINLPLWELFPVYA